MKNKIQFSLRFFILYGPHCMIKVNENQREDNFCAKHLRLLLLPDGAVHEAKYASCQTVLHVLYHKDWIRHERNEN